MTSLVNRGLWSSLPDTIGSIPTLYLGTIVADEMLEHSTWRWGYGMWATILPFCALPLILTVWVFQRKAEKQEGYESQRATILADVRSQDSIFRKIHQLLWVELDAFGALLLIAGLSLILVPISLTGSQKSDRWSQPHFIAMLVVGFVIAAAFVVWDAFFAKKPFVPYRLIKHRSVVAACILSMLDFFHYSVFTTFFTSYLQVAGHYSAGHATRIE